MDSNNATQAWVIAVVGSLVGGVVGFFLFRLLLNYGLYAAAIPGSLVGIGCGYLQKQYNPAIAIFAGVASLIGGIYSDYLVTIGAANIFDYLTGQGLMTWIMIALGTYVGYSYGGGRPRMYSAQ